MQFPPVDEQLALIRRGVEKIVPEDDLVKRLEWSRKTGTPLRVKYGIDPTGIDVHLGHTVPLRKIRQFQQLGHKAVIIIGNYTALVGDPSGRDQTRARLTQEQVEANAADYLTQVGKVIDLSQAEVTRNGEWFSTMSFLEVLELTSKVTVAQLLTRDDFAKRYAAEQAIFLHECLYPVMQAFDSVCIAADVELGGTEQLYSFMLARDLQGSPAICNLGEKWMTDAAKSRRLPNGTLPQQVGVMSPILVGTDGTRRMGKSLGNYIGISESPYDMMKKFMQLPDTCMKMYFELLTELPLDDVARLLAGHPKEAKVALTKSVIAEYHTPAAATEAADRWQREIGEKAIPDDIPTVTVPRSELVNGAVHAAKLLVLTGLCPTTSDARRAIAQGGAYLGESKERIASHDTPIALDPPPLVWVGKKRVARVTAQ